MYFQCVFKHSLWLHVVFSHTLLRHCRFNIDNNVNKRHLLTTLSQECWFSSLQTPLRCQLKMSYCWQILGVLFLYVTTQKWQQIISLCEIFIDESLCLLHSILFSVFLALVAIYFQLTSNAASLLRRTTCLCLKVETGNVVSCKKQSNCKCERRTNILKMLLFLF